MIAASGICVFTTKVRYFSITRRPIVCAKTLTMESDAAQYVQKRRFFRCLLFPLGRQVAFGAAREDDAENQTASKHS